jgi:hypothetical protein
MKRERHLIAKDAIGAIDREVWRPETPEERAEALALTFGAKPKGYGINDEIAEIRGLIDVALNGMGWPRSRERVAVDRKGQWRSITSPDDLSEGEKFHWSFLWISDAAEPLSEAYFLGKMAFDIAAIESAIKSGNMLALFRHAGRIGVHQTKIDVRRIALRYATVGKKLTGRNKGLQQKTQERIDFMHRVKRETGLKKRQEVALAAWDDPERSEYFDDFDKLYRFLGRDEF